jgi:hypothetical protein
MSNKEQGKDSYSFITDKFCQKYIIMQTNYERILRMPTYRIPRKILNYHPKKEDKR